MRTRNNTELALGMAAGPLFVVIGLAQAFTRDGFDLRRDTLSLLSNGDLGWIQVLNFILSGLHYTIASLTFVALVAAFLVLASRFAADDQRGWATATRVLAVALVVATVAISSAPGKPPVNVLFVTTALLSFLWASVLAGHLRAQALRVAADTLV